MIYFENEAAALHVFPDKNLSVTVWKGFASSPVLREILEKSKQLLSDFPIYYSIGDNRNMKVIRPADQDYINNDWLPEVIKSSQLKKSATIESEDTFGKISSDNILRQADKYITFDIAFFKSLEDAVNWLGIEVDQEELAL
jgi:hypothetical protein